MSGLTPILAAAFKAQLGQIGLSPPILGCLKNSSRSLFLDYEGPSPKEYVITGMASGRSGRVLHY